MQRWTQNYALKVIKDAPQALWRHAPTYMLHWEFQNLECKCKSGQVDSFHVCFTSVLRSRFGVQRAWPMLKANYGHRTIKISTPWMSLSVDACVLLWSWRMFFSNISSVTYQRFDECFYKTEAAELRLCVSVWAEGATICALLLWGS